MFDRLPEYPWEQLKPYSAKAALHERGAVDLSVGSPVDPTPAIIQDALNASPNDYITLSNLGVVEFQLGKMSEAESTLKKACAQDPKKSFSFTTLGIVHYRQERFDDAEKVLRQAVAINDQDFTAHNYLGIVLAASGKSKAGESEIMKSIEVNPSYADAHFNLAVIYATGKPPAKEMAKAHYKKAVALGAPADAALEKLIN